MNKRIFAVLLASAALMAGCEDNDVKPVESEVETTVVTTVPEVTEPVFREYSADDFRTINVALNLINQDPPVDVECTDISGLDFGEKVPVYNKREYAAEFYGGSAGEYESFIDKPEKGYAKTCTVEDGYCYIDVFYPSVMYNLERADSAYVKYQTYCWSVFRYDPGTGKNEEIYSWAAKDLDESCDAQQLFCNGGLFFIYYSKDGDEDCITLKRLDLSTCEVTDLYEVRGAEKHLLLNYLFDGSIYAVEFTGANLSDPDISILLYDKETGKLSQRTGIGDENFLLTNHLDDENVFINTDVECDHYRVKAITGQKSLVYGDSKSFMFYNGFDEIETYDLKKMEHSVLNFADMSSEVAVYDGKVVIGGKNVGYNGTSSVFCIIPDKGLVYLIATEEAFYGDIRVSGDGIIYCGKHRFYSEKTAKTEDGTNETGFAKFDVVEKVYTIKNK